MEPRRTQAERSAATRTKLIDAARVAFAERGYAAVGTPEIAKAAGVTRGAMYHQFADKQALFSAVAEAVEADTTQRMTDDVIAQGLTQPSQVLHAMVDAWLDACDEPELRQVLLLDAPTVLGWEALREITIKYGRGLTEQLIEAAIAAGELTALPVRPLASVLLGALHESALVIVAEPEARDDTAVVLHRLLDGLLGLT